MLVRPVGFCVSGGLTFPFSIAQVPPKLKQTLYPANFYQTPTNLNQPTSSQPLARWELSPGESRRSAKPFRMNLTLVKDAPPVDTMSPLQPVWLSFLGATQQDSPAIPE